LTLRRSTDSWVSFYFPRHTSSQYTPTSPMQFDVRGGICLYQAYVLSLIPLMTLQQHGCVMFLAPTHHVVNVRPSRDSPHWSVIPRQTPEYQCLWFQFYRASNFYCMAIAAKPSSPSGPPSAADWAAVSVAAVSETRVDAAAVVASASVAGTNDDDHPCDGHNVDNRLHDGCEDVTANDSPPLLVFLSNDDKGNAFPTRHAPSNADAQSPERQRHRGQSREEICERQRRVLRGIGLREQDKGHGGGGDDGSPARDTK
jgi:hypothetical protein